MGACGDGDGCHARHCITSATYTFAHLCSADGCHPLEGACQVGSTIPHGCHVHISTLTGSSSPLFGSTNKHGCHVHHCTIALVCSPSGILAPKFNSMFVVLPRLVLLPLEDSSRFYHPLFSIQFGRWRCDPGQLQRRLKATETSSPGQTADCPWRFRGHPVE